VKAIAASRLTETDRFRLLSPVRLISDRPNPPRRD